MATATPRHPFATHRHPSPPLNSPYIRVGAPSARGVLMPRAAMREIHDALSKDSLEVLLDDVGTIIRGQEVAAVAAQRFDLWFSPDPAHHLTRMQRGLLGALVDDPAGCALEPFRDTPSVADLDDCVRKIANHRRRLAGRRREPQPPDTRPWVIVFSPGDPLSARQEYGLLREEAPGVYRSPRGVGVVLIVLSALPRTRETLALRLLARGPTRALAIRELAALAPGAWEPLAADFG